MGADCGAHAGARGGAMSGGDSLVEYGAVYDNRRNNGFSDEAMIFMGKLLRIGWDVIIKQPVRNTDHLPRKPLVRIK